jgi:hypothetical protein
MAHIIKVTSYIHKFNHRIIFSSVKSTENLTEREIQSAEQKTSVTSLTHYRITPNKLQVWS